jgi:Flp pilus assembly protein TadB
MPATVLVVVTGLFEGYVWCRKRDRGSALILSAIPMATVAVSFHVAHFSPSVWFTYFDVGHVIMCVCALVMMFGVERMRFL